MENNEETNPLRHQFVADNEDTNPLSHQPIVDNEDTNPQWDSTHPSITLNLVLNNILIELDLSLKKLIYYIFKQFH